MWRLWHKLFGWHYVAVEFGGSTCIRHVGSLPGDRVVIWLYGEVYDLDAGAGLAVGATTGFRRRFTPLTFLPRAARDARVKPEPDATGRAA